MVPKQIFIILFISLFILCSCSKSTTPELPKPRAVIEVSVKDENDLTFYYSASMDYWYAHFTVVVSEHNGVGGTVTTCKLQFTLEDEHVSSSTYSGGTFPPKFNSRGTFPHYGTCEIYCSPTIRSSKTWDLLTITVEGKDNNGYEFEKSIYYSYTWGANNSKIIRNILKKISYISGQGLHSLYNSYGDNGSFISVMIDSQSTSCSALFYCLNVSGDSFLDLLCSLLLKALYYC